MKNQKCEIKYPIAIFCILAFILKTETSLKKRGLPFISAPEEHPFYSKLLKINVGFIGATCFFSGMKKISIPY